MAQTGDKRIASATLFAAQVDFTDPGDLKIFVDDAQLKSIEEKMAEKGYLDGSQMAGAFNMLRPNELIWSYFVNNYLKGKEPMPFDLLVWNSDSTRMPAANHSFYLRNCYLENNLTRGRMTLGGKTLDLADVTIPIYELAAREDHIAPAKSVFVGAQYFRRPGALRDGRLRPYRRRRQPALQAEISILDRRAAATANSPIGSRRRSNIPGSWWPDWAAWVAEQAPRKVPARAARRGQAQGARRRAGRLCEGES